MKKSKYYIIAIILCSIIFGIFGYFVGNKPQKVIETDTVFTTKTDTLWKDTTITIKELVPKEIVKKKVDTLYLSNGDTLNLITESKRYERSLVSDKDTCDLKIYTSGINTSLDSLKWRLKTHSVTNTVEITKYVERKKRFKDRFHIQPQAGVGYGLISKKVDAFVGVGLGIDLW
jgi:hypothetical protein